MTTNFLTTSFDPYARSPVGTSGITRLAFSTPNRNGTSAPLSVANLSTPIIFTIPSTASSLSGEAPGEQREVLCGFWDAKLGIYRRASNRNSCAHITLFAFSAPALPGACLLRPLPAALLAHRISNPPCSTEGCGTLPSPRPDGHTFKWVNATTGGWKPHMWNVTGACESLIA